MIESTLAAWRVIQTSIVENWLRLAIHAVWNMVGVGIGALVLTAICTWAGMELPSFTLPVLAGVWLVNMGSAVLDGDAGADAAFRGWFSAFVARRHPEKLTKALNELLEVSDAERLHSTVVLAQHHNPDNAEIAELHHQIDHCLDRIQYAKIVAEVGGIPSVLPQTHQRQKQELQDQIGAFEYELLWEKSGEMQL